MVVIEPIRNKKREERRQSQTVIELDTQETDGDQQSNGKDTNNFLFQGQGATPPIKQTIFHPKAINLSSTCLTDKQVRVLSLSKVLKFTPPKEEILLKWKKIFVTSRASWD